MIDLDHCNKLLSPLVRDYLQSLLREKEIRAWYFDPEHNSAEDLRNGLVTISIELVPMPVRDYEIKLIPEQES